MSGEHENGGLKDAANKVQDMVGGMVGMASAATAGSHDARAYIANACIGDLYEIEAGRLAIQRGRSEAVREFGAMMVEHHTTAMHQMRSALRSHEVTDEIPDAAPVVALDARRAGMLKHLEEAADDVFDHTYLDQQRMAHQETLALHDGYAENGGNPQLRSVARGGRPMVARHLKMLGRIGVH